MAYGTPSDPVGGTVITVSWAVSNVLDPIRWLRLLTGNADPPGSAYVVVSTSTSGTSWQKVPGSALAAGAVAAHLGYVPARADGGTLSGALTVPSTLTILAVNDLGAGGRLLLQGSTTLPSGMIDNSGNAIQFYNVSDPTKTMAFNLLTGGLGMTGALAAASAGIVGAITAASAAIVGLLSAGSISSGSTIVAGTTVTGAQLAASMADGVTSPLLINANQANVTVPNLKAAKAGAADSATVAANAFALGAVAAAGYPTLAGGGDFTTPPTINSDAIAKIATGTYAGNASARTITVGFQPKLVMHITTNGPSIQAGFTPVSGQTVIMTAPGTVSTTAIGITFSATGFALPTTNFNASGSDYAWVAFG